MECDREHHPHHTHSDCYSLWVYQRHVKKKSRCNCIGILFEWFCGSLPVLRGCALCPTRREALQASGQGAPLAGGFVILPSATVLILLSIPCCSGTKGLRTSHDHQWDKYAALMECGSAVTHGNIECFLQTTQWGRRHCKL